MSILAVTTPKNTPTRISYTKKAGVAYNVDLSQLKINTFNFARPKDHNVTAACFHQKKEMTIYHDGLYSLGATLDETVWNRSPNKFILKQTITTQTITEIVEGSPFKNQPIDILSIDIEGVDFEVLCTLDFEKYHPKVILIEQLGANDISIILEGKIFKFLKSKNYLFVNWIGATLFFRLS